MSVVTSLTDSDAFRRFVKNGPGRVVYRSGAADAVNLRMHTGRSWLAQRREPERFRDVRTFCFFVGHNKSGTSLLGALLDAHRDAIVADEADALRVVGAGLPRERIFHVLARAAEREAAAGRVTARRLGGYSYAVPEQSQGASDRPLVVGDSTSGSSTRRLAERPALLEALRRGMRDVDVRAIQVIRNPFDPIALMMIRGGRSFENAIDHYFTACDRLEAIRDALGDALLPVRYETFIADPASGLADVCRFVGLEPQIGYLAACMSILHAEPDGGRDAVPWTPRWIDEVERRIDRHGFLEGYRYAI
jgi:hypothetical protein